VSASVTVKELCNVCLNAKQALVDSGELTLRSWRNFKAAADLIVSHLGKHRLVSDLGPDDFAALRKKMAGWWGPVALDNTIQRVRAVFKYSLDSTMIDRPVVYGPGFKRPTQKTLRLTRAQKGPRMFEAEELRRMIDAAGQPMKAMVLLGVNCGFGNSVCGTLPLSVRDLDGGRADYHRPKTGVNRRCPLWPETVSGVGEAIAARPTPKDPVHAGLMFLTKQGGNWYKKTEDIRPGGCAQRREMGSRRG
jgi:integrase